jgi:FAD/FMN-containing dehydrogenase
MKDFKDTPTALLAEGSPLGESPVAALSDYGKLYTSFDPHTVSVPTDATEVSAVINEARRGARAVRVRGSAHTFSGATIPREGEVLVRTNHLDSFVFDRPGTVRVGGGAIAWDVRDLAQAHGLLMPVYNGGWAGPTIGGYLAAGGMGLRVPPADRERWLAMDSAAGAERPPLLSISETHGGFWEHVAAVTLVDGTGTIHDIDEHDPVFPWLFASFGQFGVFADVRLKLIAEPGAVYPLGLTGRVPKVQAEDPAVNDNPPSTQGDRILFWFSYLVSLGQEAAAWQELGAWVARHRPFLTPQGGWVGPISNGAPIGYRYLVTHRRFHPPLLYPRGEDFALIGLMTTFDRVGTHAIDERVLALEADFMSIARRHDFRLYPQAENIGRGLDYAAYYDAATFEHFQQLKRRFDPDGLMNPGVVFPSAVPAPPRSSLRALSGALFGGLLGNEL